MSADNMYHTRRTNTTRDNKSEYTKKTITMKFSRGIVIGCKEKSRQRFYSKMNTTTEPYQKQKGKIQVNESVDSSLQSVVNVNDNLVAQHKRKPRLTHFLSIPINNEKIVDRFKEFKNEVDLMNDPRITDSHFQETYKLHLTFGVLSLFNDEEKDSALMTLEECKEIVDSVKTRLNNPGDLLINIVGVNCINNTPPKCRVLHAKVENEILQTIANEIVAHFISKGLIEQDKNEVKLHVTMMNVVFVHRKGGKRIRNFDASAIIEKFSDYDFGEQKIDELHLSKFVKSGGEVYYDPERVLSI